MNETRNNSIELSPEETVLLLETIQIKLTKENGIVKIDITALVNNEFLITMPVASNRLIVSTTKINLK